MKSYNDFIKGLEAALRSKECLEDFLSDLEALTPDERTALLAEAAEHENNDTASDMTEPPTRWIF